MKLSARLPLFQIVIFILFTLSLLLAIFVFSEMNNLYVQRILLDNMHNNVMILSDELSINLYKPQIPSAGYFNISRQVNAIDLNVEELKAYQEQSRGESSYSRRADKIISQWDNIYSSSVEPLLSDLSVFQPLAGYNIFNIYGLKGSLKPLEESGEIELHKQTSTIISNIEILQESVNATLVDLTETASAMVGIEIGHFSRNMIRNSLLATVLMLLISIFLSFYLSYSIAGNIKNLDEALGQVASGNFHYNLRATGNDEFSEISNGFNTLTEMLWFRIDSLKDIMRDIGSAVENDVSEEDLYSLILELAIDSTASDSAFLMLYNEEENHLTMGYHLGFFPPPMGIPHNVRVKRENIKEWFDNAKIPMTGNILGDSCSRGSSFFIHDNENKGGLPENRDRRSSSFISSSIILSLNSPDKKIGVLGLAKTEPGSFFTDLDYTYMKSFANFVTITMDNFEKYQELVKKREINKEIEVAAEIQGTLLPGRMPPMGGNRIAAFSHPAKGVSGDYYDVFSLDKERTAVIICDVSGKGIPASLFMVMFRTVLRTVSSPALNAAETLAAVNREISGNFLSGTFATASLLIVNHKTGSISFSNGAHHPLYIYRSEKKSFVKFDTEGLPLGIDMRGEYGHKYIKVAKGDYLFLFTDGLTEARNDKGEELGTGRLLKYAGQFTDQSPERMKELIEDLLRNFEGEAGQHDDETFMALLIG